jgi:hypothetical protein
LLFNSLRFSYVLDINLWSIEELAKFFSHSMGCLLILVVVFFDVQKVFNLKQLHLSILDLISWASGVLFRK